MAYITNKQRDGIEREKLRRAHFGKLERNGFTHNEADGLAMVQARLATLGYPPAFIEKVQVSWETPIWFNHDRFTSTHYARRVFLVARATWRYRNPSDLLPGNRIVTLAEGRSFAALCCNLRADSQIAHGTYDVRMSRLNARVPEMFRTRIEPKYAHIPFDAKAEEHCRPMRSGNSVSHTFMVRKKKHEKVAR